ncbi:hypothetical protein JM654_23695 [Microbacterium oxydans]|nr:hypothetical protein [Microbacterium oxydans]
MRRRTIAATLAAASLRPTRCSPPRPPQPSRPEEDHGGGGHGPGQCSLVDKTLTATANVKQGLTEQFTAYGNTGGAWTGGDSTYSPAAQEGEDRMVLLRRSSAP